MPPPLEVLCISYFSPVLGPQIFYCNDPEIFKYKHPELEKILEFNDNEGSFIFAGLKYQTSNFIFYSQTNQTNSGRILIMLTYMVRSSYFKKNISNVFKYLESIGPILNEMGNLLSQEINNFGNFLLDVQSITNTKNQKKLSNHPNSQKFFEIFNQYSKKLREKQQLLISSRNIPLKKIFIVGDQDVAKINFLRDLEVLQFHKQQNSDLPTKIYEIAIDNMEILTFECVKEDKSCNYCINFDVCLKNAQAFILIFDQSNRGSLLEAKKNLDYIIEQAKGEIPILLIGNKSKKEEMLSKKEIYTKFELKKLEKSHYPINLFSFNLKKQENLKKEALRWLVRSLV
jgi:hypothetical protein